jgi:hypothetical protein
MRPSVLCWAGLAPECNRLGVTQLEEAGSAAGAPWAVPAPCSVSLTLESAPFQLVFGGGFQPLAVTSSLNCVTPTGIGSLGLAHLVDGLPTSELFWWSSLAEVARLLMYLQSYAAYIYCFTGLFRPPVLAVTGLYWPLAPPALFSLPLLLRLSHFDTALTF